MAKDGAFALKIPVSLTPERAARTTELHVPRVMSVEGYFACGICHKCYSTHAKASQCLSGCVVDEPPRISVRVKGERQIALCPLCSKGYGSEADALLCLERCLETTPDLLQAVIDFGLKVLAASRSPQRFRGPGHAHHSLRTFTRHAPSRAPLSVPSQAPASLPPVTLPQALDDGFEEEKPKAAGVLQKASPAPAPAAPAAPQPMVEEKRTDGPFRQVGQKPFSRADARYECTCCHERYFTKMEVENCFNSHPLEP